MLQAFITGITMGLYLVISVSPLLFTVIKQSLQKGIRGGFSFVASIWFSDIFVVVLSNTFLFLPLILQLLTSGRLVMVATCC